MGKRGKQSTVYGLTKVSSNGVGQSPCGSATRGDAALLGLKIVSVSTSAAVGKQEAPLLCLVKIEPGNISGTDPLVLHLPTLVWNINTG